MACCSSGKECSPTRPIRAATRCRSALDRRGHRASTTRRTSDHGAGRSVRSAVTRLLASRAADATLAELVALRAERAFAGATRAGVRASIPARGRFVELAQLRAPVVIVTARRARRIRCGAAARRDCTTPAPRSSRPTTSAADAPAPASYELALAHLARRRVVKADHVVVLATTHAGHPRRSRGAGCARSPVNAPAHVALEADAAVGSLTGVTLDDVDALLGIAARRSRVSTRSVQATRADDRRRRRPERRARVRQRRRPSTRRCTTRAAVFDRSHRGAASA